jgi:hypothetical protein
MSYPRHTAMHATSCRRGHRLQARSSSPGRSRASDCSPENPWGLSPLECQYIGWIMRARRQTTQDNRLQQMLDELATGDRYMQMAYRATEV